MDTFYRGSLLAGSGVGNMLTYLSLCSMLSIETRDILLKLAHVTEVAWLAD